ncbi:hypothetical protein LTR86_000444 [Recurvomyces mirabilis]|nr:hypothetical protein LTR86_000444 [Recurvomyces mirabilis]
MADKVPAERKVWQYAKTTGGMENNLQLITTPMPTPKPTEHLIRVLAGSLNAVDYKIAELSVIGGFAVPKPATPGMDIAGEIVVAADGSDLKPGDLVFGAAGGSLAAMGGLAEYITTPKERVTAIPKGVSTIDAASLPTGAVTSYQAIVPHVKPGSHVLFNGGSGGVGVIAIQVAKIKGCHVTVTCSSRNIDLCKKLGADVVVDYTQGCVMDQLAALDYKFDLIVDGVGNDKALYWASNKYTNRGAKFVYIAFAPPGDVAFVAAANTTPSFLGGPRAKLTVLFADFSNEQMSEVIGWMAEGKLKSCIDSTWPMNDVPNAYKKLKSQRVSGKVVIEVAAA